MAVTALPRNTNLTKDKVFDIFWRHFNGKYQVVSGGPWRRDFVVKKNWLVAVGVGLEQTTSETKFVYSGFAPSFLGRLLSGRDGRVVFMLFWNGLTNEIRSFIETSPELRQAT